MRGWLAEEFYDEVGLLVESLKLTPCSPVVAVNIPIGQWHSLKCLESGTVLFEAKDGAYRPLEADEIWNG